jgi:O-antigen/teichoic acid export membrane protein
MTEQASETAAGKQTVRHLARSSVVAFGVYGAGVGLSYLCQLAIARSVSLESYGIYAYVTAWVTLLGYFAALGFDVSLLRFLPGYRARGNWDLARGVVGYAERRCLATGVAIALAGTGIVVSLRQRLGAELTEAFAVGLAMVPVLALLWVRAAVVRAFGGVLLALAPDRLLRDGLLLVLVGAAVVSSIRPLAAPYVMASALAGAVIGLTFVTWAKARLYVVPGAASSTSAAALWRRTALPLVAIAVAEAAINRTGVVALGWAGDRSGAGIYALIFSVTSVIVLPRIAINTRFAPMVSEFFARSDQPGLQDLIAKGASWTLIGAVCLAVPLFAFGDTILGFFGPGFQTALWPMRILLLSQVVAASAGSQIFLMTMTGQERSAAIIVVLAALANVALTFALVNPYGIAGAATANAITLLLWNIAMGVMICRRLGVIPSVLAVLAGRNRTAMRRDRAARWAGAAGRGSEAADNRGVV